MTKDDPAGHIREPSPAVAHVETIPAPNQSGATRIRCWCPIGHDHTYADWLEEFSRTQYEV